MRKADIVVLHYFEMGSNTELRDELKNMMLDNLNNGSIKKYHISACIELSNGIFSEIGTWPYRIYDCRLYKKNEIEYPEDIEQTRNLYCMDPIADFEKKIIYRYSHNNDFDFRYTIIKSHISDTGSFLAKFHAIAEIKKCK